MALLNVRDRRLFSATELALLESSEPAHIKAQTPVQVNARIARARKYWDKYRGLAREQHRSSKKGSHATGRPLDTLRTERKAEIFALALDRLQKRQEQLTKAGRGTPPRTKAAGKPSRRSGTSRKAGGNKTPARQTARAAGRGAKMKRLNQKTNRRAIGHIRASGARRQAKRDAR
jgi:hypothetical protein